MQPQSYPNRSTSKRRARLNPSVIDRIMDRDRRTCVYCGFRANCIDHVVPWSYGGGHEDDNLVASCDVCNKILSDRVFDSVDSKRQFVRDRYGDHFAGRVSVAIKSLSICGDCGFVFAPSVPGATNVLCAQCYLDDSEWHPRDDRRKEKRIRRDAHLVLSKKDMVRVAEMLNKL